MTIPELWVKEKKRILVGLGIAFIVFANPFYLYAVVSDYSLLSKIDQKIRTLFSKGANCHESSASPDLCYRDALELTKSISEDAKRMTSVGRYELTARILVISGKYKLFRKDAIGAELFVRRGALALVRANNDYLSRFPFVSGVDTVINSLMLDDFCDLTTRDKRFYELSKVDSRHDQVALLVKVTRAMCREE